MTIVRLTTDGTEEGLVEDAQIPPFNKPPDVILWGSRVFVPALVSGTGVHRFEGEGGILRLIYREAFAFTIPVRS